MKVKVLVSGRSNATGWLAIHTSMYGAEICPEKKSEVTMVTCYHALSDLSFSSRVSLDRDAIGKPNFG
eukprot:1139994-Pelagomonas_calceolata.AAC.1